METTIGNKRRIAKNTMLLYFRMLFTMVVSLYTSRVVLNTLGVDDFGIYNVVGGVVAMFTILSGSLSAAISRFITFELGREVQNQDKLKQIFSTAVLIQILLVVVIFIIGETIGLWFLNNKMNISSERLYAANWVFQCSILTFAINLISIPYNASIIAHERMKVFAYVSILEVGLKLLVVYLLWLSPFDKLIVYGLLLMFVAFIIRIVYGIYCKKHFEECTFHFTLNKKLIKEMLSFSGWNFIGSSSSILRDQGINILLNIFVGTVVNAARGIAFQVNNAINGFVNNFMTALNPQIVKSYASGNYSYMHSLMQQGARFSFYLLLFLSLPVLMETEIVLKIWLNIVPEHTANFVRLVLIFAMSESLSGTLVTAMLATGRIRNYQIVVGGLQLLNFPISYLFLKINFPPEVTMIIAILMSLCCLLTRLYFLKKMVRLSVIYYLKHVVLGTIFVLIISSILPLIIRISMDASVFRFVLVTLVSMLSTVLIVYNIGCTMRERQQIRLRVSVIKNKIIKK